MFGKPIVSHHEVIDISVSSDEDVEADKPSSSSERHDKCVKVQPVSKRSGFPQNDAGCSSLPGSTPTGWTSDRGGWLCPRIKETLAEFVRRCRPSQIPSETSPFIYISGCERETTPREEDRRACIQECLELVGRWREKCRLARATIDQVKAQPSARVEHRRRNLKSPALDLEAAQVAAELFELAKRYNYGSGKFLLFCDSQVVDLVWAKIAEVTAKGDLSSASKVSTLTREKNHVICVYIDRFWDRVTAVNVLERLGALGFRITSFKPDILTSLNLYQKDLQELGLANHLRLYQDEIRATNALLSKRSFVEEGIDRPTKKIALLHISQRPTKC